MPFTPLHWGPALLIGLLAYKYLDFPTFMISNVIVDVRATLVFFGLMQGPLHGILHTFTGATALASILTVSAVAVRDHQIVIESMELLLKPQKTNWIKIAAASFLGVYLHVTLDSVIYTDIAPLYPFTSGNPFLEVVPVSAVLGFCALTLFLGFVYYLIILARQEMTS